MPLSPLAANRRAGGASNATNATNSTNATGHTSPTVLPATALVLPTIPPLSASIASLLTKPVHLTLGGVTWPLLITHRVLIWCQAATGLDILTGGGSTRVISTSVDNSLYYCRPSARLTQAIVWATRRQATGEDVSLTEVGKLITIRTLSEVRAAVLDAWLASMPEPDKVKKKKKAQTRPTVFGDLPLPEPVHAPMSILDAWSIARFDLQLTADEWLGMTMRMVHALRKRKLEQMQHQEMMAGIVAAATVNFSECHPKRPAKPEHFMIHQLDEDDMPVTGQMISAVLAASMKAPKGQ